MTCGPLCVHYVMHIQIFLPSGVLSNAKDFQLFKHKDSKTKTKFKFETLFCPYHHNPLHWKWFSRWSICSSSRGVENDSRWRSRRLVSLVNCRVKKYTVLYGLWTCVTVVWWGCKGHSCWRDDAGGAVFEFAAAYDTNIIWRKSSSGDEWYWGVADIPYEWKYIGHNSGGRAWELRFIWIRSKKANRWIPCLLVLSHHYPCMLQIRYMKVLWFRYNHPIAWWQLQKTLISQCWHYSKRSQIVVMWVPWRRFSGYPVR